MDDKPLVSVVIPTFNSERYIEKCLRSVRNQTYDNIEIIVVDKGSGDRTVEIAEKYAKVFVINAKERSEQMNFGVKKAKGKYFYRVDLILFWSLKWLKKLFGSVKMIVSMLFVFITLLTLL